MKRLRSAFALNNRSGLPGAGGFNGATTVPSLVLAIRLSVIRLSVISVSI
jgi:hypothetical protein